MSRTRSLYTPENTLIKRYDSPGDFMRDIKTHPVDKQTFGDMTRNDRWYGMSGADALHKAEYGDTTYLKDAEKLIETMREEGLLSIGQKVIEADVVGIFPNIPEYLAGQPEQMFAIHESDLVDNSSPLRIYVELVASAGIGVEELTKRGLAILGFVMAMQNIRPIEVYGVSITGNGANGYRSSGSIKASGSVIRLESAPLDLDRALFILGNPAFFRHLCYANARYMIDPASSSGWLPWAWDSNSDSPLYEPAMREAIGMEPHDVFISGTYLTQADYRTNPSGWIKRMLQKYTVIE